MAIRATDIPDPFQAIIQANAAAGARGNANYQGILADATAMQAFEQRELQTEQQRQAVETLRKQAKNERDFANLAKSAISRQYMADFQLPIHAAAQAGQWGVVAERYTAMRNMYFTKPGDDPNTKTAKMWSLENLQVLQNGFNSTANIMSHEFADMNEIRGRAGEDVKKDLVSIERLTAMAPNDAEVAKWLIETGPEESREGVARNFGYGYEIDHNGNSAVFKEGTIGHKGLEARRKRVVQLMEQNQMSLNDARVQVGVEMEQQQRHLARVNNIAKTNNIPHAEAQALAIEETRTQHWTTGLSLWRQSHPNASQAQETAAKNVLQFAAASKSPEDVAQFESDQDFLALDPRQQQFIKNNNRIAEIEAQGQIVTNPGVGSDPAMRATTSEEVSVMSAIRNSIPGTSTVADSRKTNSLNALLGGLGDPTQQKAFQRASGRGIRAFGVQLTGRGHPALTAPAGRIARVKENMVRIGNTEESIALARSKGRFEQVREDLQWFGVSEMGITQALSAMATPSTGDSPANASVNPELEANRVEAKRLGAENDELTRQMKQNGIPEPGTDAFDALVQGTRVAAFVRNRAADTVRAQTGLLEAGQKSVELGQKERTQDRLAVAELRQIVESGVLDNDKKAKERATTFLADNAAQFLGIGGAPDQSQFGRPTLASTQQFGSESAARSAGFSSGDVVSVLNPATGRHEPFRLD